MGCISPGNFELMEEAAELCKFPEGAKILDEGCGEGDTLAFLEKTLGICGTGIDISAELLDKGKEKYPALDLRRGEMEMLEFPSCTFDGVIMECTLSLSVLQPEALHEAWCVLKKGGWLIVTDLYDRNPDPAEFARARQEAMAAHAKPHEKGDCERDRETPSEYCLNGVFVKEALLEACAETGFEVAAWRDKTSFLRDFAAGKIFEHGSMEAYWKSVLPEGAEPSRFCKADAGGNLGYFLMVLRKGQ
ncbi:MAG: class I SAM-dependent methyltransferase [Clostridiales Family XIII bacterium]|jgi:ubiquinone/menaquinone biosynthesis C-methylase UbiE|nr:class I SAM-dependent methyltransferase [Clostridiales Family XIII bacterium]